MRKDSRDGLLVDDGAGVAQQHRVNDESFYQTRWLIEQWDEDKIDFAREKLTAKGITHIQDGVRCLPRPSLRSTIASAILGRDVHEMVVVPRIIPITHGVTSDALRKLGITPDREIEVLGNLLLNEGLGQLTNLLIGGTANAFDNANSYLGVGDSTTAEAATQTELQATQNAANRFYKAMVATYPQRSGANNETINWRSDFTSTEANFAWQEWTVARGATTASGSGFLVGTVNLNRKVQSLGTKSTGTWTLTGSITFS